jgi:hypothetical protein
MRETIREKRGGENDLQQHFPRICPVKNSSFAAFVDAIARALRGLITLRLIESVTSYGERHHRGTRSCFDFRR